MAVNPTTGLYDLAGGDTSAVATTGINNNFTQLYNRVRNSYIIEEGTSGDWHYRVHYQPNSTGTNAVLEMWLQKNYTYNNLTTNNMWSNDWKATLIPAISYPNVGITIAEAPIEVAQITCDFGGLTGSYTSDGRNTEAHTGIYSIIRPASQTAPANNANIRINYYVTYCFNL